MPTISAAWLLDREGENAIYALVFWRPISLASAVGEGLVLFMKYVLKRETEAKDQLLAEGGLYSSTRWNTVQSHHWNQLPIKELRWWKYS